MMLELKWHQVTRLVKIPVINFLLLTPWHVDVESETKISMTSWRIIASYSLSEHFTTAFTFNGLLYLGILASLGRVGTVVGRLLTD